MRSAVAAFALAGLLVGGTVGPATAQGYTEVGSVVWVDGSMDEPDTPYVEAIVFAGNGGPTGRHHGKIDCRLFVIEREPPATTVSAYCQVGRKARGGKAFLRVESVDGDRNHVAGCQSKTQKLRRYVRFACTFDDPQANP